MTMKIVFLLLQKIWKNLKEYAERNKIHDPTAQSNYS